MSACRKCPGLSSTAAAGSDLSSSYLSQEAFANEGAAGCDDNTSERRVARDGRSGARRGPPVFDVGGRVCDDGQEWPERPTARPPRFCDDGQEWPERRTVRPPRFSTLVDGRGCEEGQKWPERRTVRPLVVDAVERRGCDGTEARAVDARTERRQGGDEGLFWPEQRDDKTASAA